MRKLGQNSRKIRQFLWVKLKEIRDGCRLVWCGSGRGGGALRLGDEISIAFGISVVLLHEYRCLDSKNRFSVEDPNGEHIIAELTDATECGLFLLLKLHDDHLFGGTLRTELAATVATVMSSVGHAKLGATLQTLGPILPVGHSAERVEKRSEQLPGGHLVVEDGDAMHVANAQSRTTADDRPTEFAVAVHVS